MENLSEVEFEKKLQKLAVIIFDDASERVAFLNMISYCREALNQKNITWQNVEGMLKFMTEDKLMLAKKDRHEALEQLLELMKQHYVK